MSEPAREATAGVSIEVTFQIERAVRVVKEIDLIDRFMLHEGKKQIRDLIGLRDTLAGELRAIALQAEKEPTS